MKVHIGPYKNWFGPYQIADAIFFWCEKYPEKDIENRWDYKTKDWLGEFLAHGFHKKIESVDGSWRMKRDRPETWFYKLLLWIDSKKKRTMKIHIDKWDSWNIDSTLSPIILPLLKQLRETKHGSGYIDMEDVPEYMRTTSFEEYDSQKCFEFYHAEEVTGGYDIHRRYEWVLDEMIWAFEQLQPDCDWEEQYRSGEHDIVWVPDTTKLDENGKPKFHTMTHGPNDTYKCDYEAMQKHQDRISNGLRLFGKYFQTLWD